MERVRLFCLRFQSMSYMCVRKIRCCVGFFVFFLIDNSDCGSWRYFFILMSVCSEFFLLSSWWINGFSCGQLLFGTAIYGWCFVCVVQDFEYDIFKSEFSLWAALRGNINGSARVKLPKLLLINFEFISHVRAASSEADGTRNPLPPRYAIFNRLRRIESLDNEDGMKSS